MFRLPSGLKRQIPERSLLWRGEPLLRLKTAGKTVRTQTRAVQIVYGVRSCAFRLQSRILKIRTFIIHYIKAEETRNTGSNRDSRIVSIQTMQRNSTWDLSRENQPGLAFRHVSSTLLALIRVIEMLAVAPRYVDR